MKYDEELETYEWMIFVRSDTPKYIQQVVDAAQVKAVKINKKHGYLTVQVIE